MRTAHKAWTWIAAGTFCLVALGDLLDTDTVAPTPTSSARVAAAAPSIVAPTYAPPTTVTPAPAVPAVEPGSTVTVTEVIDGDTFVADGQEVRVLGIDSCETSTSGGKEARQTAETFLEGQQVTLRTEPGVDLDRYDRQLRYVDLPGGLDYGTFVVGYDHTGVYEGRHDADPGYVDELRAADVDGRTCSGPATSTTTPSYSDDDDDVYVPLPRRGDNGLPDGALTGGYCSKKWWC